MEWTSKHAEGLRTNKEGNKQDKLLQQMRNC
jgi:hypothetical protein